MNSQRNPWQTRHSKVVYQNPWICVREDQVINPAGNNGLYGVVDFQALAIGIIPIDADGQTWLVGQYRYAIDEYSWEIPMGGSPLADDPLDGAKRELREETGLSAQNWQHLMKVHTSNSICNETGHIYIATDLTPGQSTPDDTEQLAIRQLPLTEAFELARNGSITDCITQAGLMRLQADILAGRIVLPNAPSP